MPEAKWRLQHLEFKTMTDFYQTILANSSQNNKSSLGNFDAIKNKKYRLIRVLCIIQMRRFLECSEVPGVGMFINVLHIDAIAKTLHSS